MPSGPQSGTYHGRGELAGRLELRIAVPVRYDPDMPVRHACSSPSHTLGWLAGAALLAVVCGGRLLGIALLPDARRAELDLVLLALALPAVLLGATTRQVSLESL